MAGLSHFPEQTVRVMIDLKPCFGTVGNPYVNPCPLAAVQVPG